MKKFLVVFILLLSQQIFAANVILEKHATSGLGIPENSFRKDCFIYNEGYVESSTVNGDGTAISFSKMLSRRTMVTLRSFLGVVRRGEIETGPVMCDGGNNLLYGYHRGTKFIIDELYDCSSSSSNTHPAGDLLRKMAENLCGF